MSSTTAFSRSDEHRLHFLRELKEQTSQLVLNGPGGGRSPSSTPKPAPLHHSRTTSQSILEASLLSPTSANAGPFATPTNRNTTNPSANLTTTPVPSASKGSNVGVNIDTIHGATTTTTVTAEFPEESWNADLQAELHVLETKYDSFIQQGLQNMRAMAASGLNTGSSRATSGGSGLRRLWQNFRRGLGGGTVDQKNRESGEFADDFDVVVAPPPSAAVPFVLLWHDATRLGWMTFAVSFILSMFVAEQVLTVSTPGASQYLVTQQSYVVKHHVVQCLLGLACAMVWINRGGARLYTLCILPARAILTIFLALFSVFLLWKEQRLWPWYNPAAVTSGHELDVTANVTPLDDISDNTSPDGLLASSSPANNLPPQQQHYLWSKVLQSHPVVHHTLTPFDLVQLTIIKPEFHLVFLGGGLLIAVLTVRLAFMFYKQQSGSAATNVGGSGGGGGSGVAEPKPVGAAVINVGSPAN